MCTRVTVVKRFAVCSGAKTICIQVQLARLRNYCQLLNLRSRYRRKTKNRLPPENYRRIALPPKNTAICWFTASATMSLPPKNEKPPIDKNYRRIVLPPKKYRHILVYRFRQSRYHRKMKNRIPSKNYRRMAIPPRLCPPKKPLPTTTLKKMWAF